MFIHWWHLSVDQNLSQFKNAIQIVEKTPRYNLQYTVSHLSHSLLGVECMTRSVISVNHFRFSNCVEGSCKSCLEYTRNALVFHQLDTTFMTAKALKQNYNFALKKFTLITFDEKYGQWGWPTNLLDKNWIYDNKMIITKCPNEYRHSARVNLSESNKDLILLCLSYFKYSSLIFLA